ncbi:MAG: hypothetical protein LPH21_01440, partial [Shewanella sp.]|nr:hypothetical protein [Shewanella sp.]
GQRLSSLSTALTLICVEQLHHSRVALYKTTAKNCKNHLQRSTAPRNPQEPLQDTVFLVLLLVL